MWYISAMSAPFSYDVMSYPMKVFLQTHPDRIATQATLFGMSPAPVENCRVLELGCGSGGSLISYAYHLPNAEFVGVDLGVSHIEDADRAAKALNLTNVRFIQMDVMDVTEEKFGKFDYIIAHGLFSWVPEFVRERVLELCRALLTDNGVGYISYNAFPGSHYRQMVQEMLRFHASHFTEPIDKVKKSLSFLAFLSQNASDKEVYRPFLAKELQRHAPHQAADIFHDDLSDTNTAFYFHEFASMLKAHGMQYLAEVEIVAMGTSGFTTETRQFLDSLENVIEREQYMDFFRGRVFRQTLFCREEIQLERNPKPSILNSFKLGSSMKPMSESPDLLNKKVEIFKGQSGVTIEIDHPLTKAALVHLGDIWGRVIPFSELLEEAKTTLLSNGFHSADWKKEFATANEIFLQICLSTGFVELHLFQPESDTSIPERPKLNRLAKLQIENCDYLTTELNLSVHIDNPMSREFLRLADGGRTRDELKSGMERFIKISGELKDKAKLVDELDAWIDDSLPHLSALGMFAS